jgi:hypothetical protein
MSNEIQVCPSGRASSSLAMLGLTGTCGRHTHCALSAATSICRPPHAFGSLARQMIGESRRGDGVMLRQLHVPPSTRHVEIDAGLGVSRSESPISESAHLDAKRALEHLRATAHRVQKGIGSRLGQGRCRCTRR